MSLKVSEYLEFRVIVCATSVFLSQQSQGQCDPITNGSFNDGLIGWIASEFGGGRSPGFVVDAGGLALFVEGDSFLVTLEQQFTIPHGATQLSFQLAHNFDLMDMFVPDAFEVSLLNDSMQSVVPTWDIKATTFFNLQEDGWTNLGQTTAWDGGTVTLDLAGVPAGISVTLFFDLVGGDADTQSAVVINSVQLTAIDTSPPSILCLSKVGLPVTGNCPVDCPDIINNDVVDVDDLLFVLLSWGTPGCGGQTPCCADLDGNGAVDVDDLIEVIVRWGACEAPNNFCSAIVPDLTDTVEVEDDCPGPVTITQKPAPGSAIGFGFNVIELTATDAAGNMASCTVDALVADETAPVIACPSDILVEAAGPKGAIVEFTTVALDPCDPDPLVTCEPLSSGDVFPIGTTVVTCTARDLFLNESSCSFAVTVHR